MIFETLVHLVFKQMKLSNATAEERFCRQKVQHGHFGVAKRTLRHQLDLIEQTVPVVVIMVREALQRRGLGSCSIYGGGGRV